MGFNGATAMEPWKRGHREGRDGKHYVLQWGHGDGAVEERKWSKKKSARAIASMGPRRWSRGRGEAVSRGEQVVSRFNGATAMEPWKRS